jgi:transcriptional regulator with XRE-family HTH domain
MDKINDRFLQVMEYYNQSPSKFADELGVIRSSISHIISGRNKPGLDLIQKLLTTFPEVDADWLLLGKGKMIQPKEPDFKIPGAQLSLFDATDPKQKAEEIKKSPETSFADMKPGEPENQQAGNNNIEIEKTKPEIVVKSQPIKRITVYYGDKSFQDFYPEED